MAQDSPSKGTSRWTNKVVIFSLMASCFILGAVLGPMMIATTIPRPQLDVKNTGQSPMTVRLERLGDKGRYLLQPGREGGFRVLPGDVLTIISSQNESAKSKRFQLGMRGDTILIKAEINADHPEKVEASYLFASEWTRGPESYAK